MPFFLLAGAGLLGAGIGALGATGAAKTEASAANHASDVQLQMFNQTQQNEAPFLKGGQNALAQLLQGLGINPGQDNANIGNGSLIAPFDPSKLAQTPGYQFQLQQGEQAIQDSATATGGIGGGNTLKALMGYGEGLASTTYQQQLQDYLAQQQQQFGMLQTVAGSGQNAAANLGALGAQTGQSIGNNIIGAGNASAAGQVGVTNALTGGISSLSSNYLLAQLLQGGGGASAANGALGSGG